MKLTKLETAILDQDPWTLSFMSRLKLKQLGLIDDTKNPSLNAKGLQASAALATLIEYNLATSKVFKK